MDQGPQAVLERELIRLKATLGLTDALRVVFSPKADHPNHGEVVGHTIFIYDSDIPTAIKTLRHEVVDYMVSQAIKPYMEMANLLMRDRNEKAYKKKEEVVEGICRLLGP